MDNTSELQFKPGAVRELAEAAFDEVIGSLYSNSELMKAIYNAVVKGVDESLGEMNPDIRQDIIWHIFDNVKFERN
jgi:hypothetical protein